MKNSPLYILALILLLTACKPTVPSQYIQPDDMENILYDYHMAQAMVRYKGGDDRELQSNLYFQAVLQKYDVTEADFDSSLVYYYSHVDRLAEIYKKVSTRITDNAKHLGTTVGDISRYSQYSASGDTANIWMENSDVLLLPRPTRNRFGFVVKADSTFQLGDSFMFQFMTEYIYQSGNKDAVLCIVAKYEGDSIVQTTSHVSVSGITQLRIPPNRERMLNELRGFIYLNDGGDNSDTRKMMFISQIQLIRFHNKDIQANHGTTEKSDTVKTDSLQRGTDPRGAETDSVRDRAFREFGRQHLSLTRRTSRDGVDAGQHSAKE